MKSKLGNLAQFQTGLTDLNGGRGLDTISPQILCSILQGDAIGSYGEIIEVNLQKMKMELSFEQYLLKSGDVAILTKGTAVRAAYINDDYAALNLIPSMSITIARLHKNKLLGEVLVAFINSPKGQVLVKNLQQGVLIPGLPLNQLKELEVPIPDFKIQKKISELFCVNIDCYLKTVALAEQQNQAANSIMFKLMEETSNE